MRTFVGSRTLPCDNTVYDKARVKWNSGTGKLTVCAATDLAAFIVDGVPSNGYCSAIPRKTADGIAIAASGVIGVGVAVYGAANGAVSASNAGGAVAEGTNWGTAVNGGYADVQLV